MTGTSEDAVAFIGDDYIMEFTDEGEGHSSSFIDVRLVRIFLGNRVTANTPGEGKIRDS